jgi:tetratricopeptide (TPR) repeat protein
MRLKGATLSCLQESWRTGAMRARLSLTILMLFWCAATVFAQEPTGSPPTWKQEFLRARQVWERGETERAFKVLEKAYALAPDDTARAQIAFRYADWAQLLGQYATARRWYQRCLELAPPGSDLIRRASNGLNTLPAPPPAPPRPYPAPYPAEIPAASRMAPFGKSVIMPVVAASLFTLISTLLLLQWASGWQKGALFMQVFLSLMLTAAITMMLPLAVLLIQQQLQPQPDSWVAGGLTLGSVACLAFAARTWQQGQLLRNTPLSRLRSASHGFMKARGAAEPAFGIIHSQVGNIPALYLHEVSERYVRRTERYYDAQRKVWRTRTVYRWETIYRFAQGVNFVLDDGTGKAIVQVEGAEFHPDHLALFYNYRPVRSFPWFAHVGDVRTRVHYIPPNATVTVWARYYERDLPGSVRDEMYLEYDRFHKCMVVLEGNESKVYTSRTGTGLVLAVLGLLMLLAVLFILLNPGVVTEYLSEQDFY